MHPSEVDDIDPHRYIDRLPSVAQQAKRYAHLALARLVLDDVVNIDNYQEWCESIATETVDKFTLLLETEVVGSSYWNKLLTELIFYGSENWPTRFPF